jgi:hypothetical protein
MPKDFYVQPDAPDPVLPDDVVLKLSRQHTSDAQAVTDVDETGGEARTYMIDETLILKTQRPQQLRPRTSLSKEVFFLNQLAAAAPDLSVPRVLGYGREQTFDGTVVEYTLMTRMPGIAMRPGRAVQRRTPGGPQEHWDRTATHPLLTGRSVHCQRPVSRRPIVRGHADTLGELLQ